MAATGNEAVEVFLADLSDLRQVRQLATAFRQQHNELHLLVNNAGAIFMGHYTPEAAGDYLAGPNHTLPTGGTARFFSPLSVDDFVKKSSIIYFSKAGLQRVAEDIVRITGLEGLDAHGRSVSIRLDQ